MNSPATISAKARELGCAAVIPTYNNAGTLLDVVENVRQYVPHVIVVNDGSTDGTLAILETVEGIEVISYGRNRGKGHALKRGLRAADERGFRYALTIDSDGQHFAEDIALFLAQAESTPDSLIIGARNLAEQNMPSKNTFANRFSNFWFRIETGRRMDDTQSGFRLYPLAPLRKMSFITSRYEFELESAVRLAWKSVPVVNVPVRVYYAPEGERVSHFKPVRDFTRISALNSVLVIVALLYYYPLKFFRWLSWANLTRFIKNNVTQSKESNRRLSAAIGLGVFWGIAPVWGYQMVLAGVTAHLFRLNKVISVASSNISIPPMIPFILYGSYAAGGLVLGRPAYIPLKDITLDKLGGSLLQYGVGSLVLAVTAGLVAWAVSFLLLRAFRKEPANG